MKIQTCLWFFINVERQPSKKFLFVIARNKSSTLGKKPKARPWSEKFMENIWASICILLLCDFHLRRQNGLGKQDLDRFMLLSFYEFLFLSNFFT